MVSGNADVVRLVFDRLNRGEVEQAFEFAAPDFVSDWSNSLSPAQGEYSGLDETKAHYSSLFDEPWEWIRFELLEVVELDAANVLSVNRARMRGQGSGAEVGATAATIWAFSEGKVVRSTLYQSKDDALAAFEAR